MAAGAKFVRADLHIHSYGEYGSFDVNDTSMTPEAIVDTAIEKGLSIISITDHNEIRNSESAIKHALHKNILVIPGIEISTTQGHLLVYFENFQNLRSYYGKLTITENRQICQQGIVECLNLAEQFKGVAILAHIELSSGFEKTIGRFGPHMNEVFNHKLIYGLEISSKESISFYTDDDSSQDRKNLLKSRRDALNLDEGYNLPKLMSSDAHTLNKLGINAEGAKKLTRIKVDHLDFHSFLIALISHESRIRLEDFIPEQRPLIKTIKIEGGLLDNLEVELSSNLTCIIGSRGAGKSTLLESIRETTGNKSTSRVVDSEVWPQSISLTYEDETGQLIEFRRDKNSLTKNYTDSENGISKINIESYGQGETADTIQHSAENPLVLANFLDSFLDLTVLKNAERDCINKLLSNRSESIKLRLDLLSLDETKRALNNEIKKLENLEKEKAGELVKLQSALIKEREIRNRIINDLKTLINTYSKILANTEVFDNFKELNDQDIFVGRDYFNKVKELVAEFANIVKTKSEELNSSLNQKISELKAELNSWHSKEKEIQDSIDKRKEELTTKGIPYDLGKINQISNDIINLRNRLRNMENSKNKLTELETERKELIKNRIDIKRKLYLERYNFAQTINNNLKNTLDGLFISVKYENGKCSDSFEKTIKNVMEWRTSQVPKAFLISLQVTPLELAEICKTKNINRLKELKDESNSRLLSDSDAYNIIERFLKDNLFEELEGLDFEDRPSILVTKVFNDDHGIKQRSTKPISQLSLGQQQSILLAILMLSKSKKPLIIDQPEDNLDSEFIFKTIVKNLRIIKESRQVIIITHNPNIAVLGDAELIVPLKSTSIKAKVMESGSIDRPKTREICCDILEGGRSAFNQRKFIYGI